ncbi:unnamed protein product [Strongylus vulgaris]|uniref:Uncharacterized protein n=1 Tax=Strongylus vulgaris TaxID=40348 RepID=A0A3P7J5U6_STRVU|nr:unnamed protein product [Strongylus vulgaris]
MFEARAGAYSMECMVLLKVFKRHIEYKGHPLNNVNIVHRRAWRGRCEMGTEADDSDRKEFGAMIGHAEGLEIHRKIGIERDFR